LKQEQPDVFDSYVDKIFAFKGVKHGKIVFAALKQNEPE